MPADKDFIASINGAIAVFERSSKQSATFDSTSGGLVTWSNRKLTRFQISKGNAISLGESVLESYEVVDGLIINDELYATLISPDKKMWVAVGEWTADDINFAPLKGGSLVSSKPSSNGIFGISNNQAVELFDSKTRSTLSQIDQDCASMIFDPVSPFFLIRQHDATDLYIAGRVSGQLCEYLPRLLHAGAECEHFDLRNGIAVFLALGCSGNSWRYAVCIVDLTGRHPNCCVPIAGELIQGKRIELVRLTPSLEYVLILCEFMLFSCSLTTGELKELQFAEAAATVWFDFMPSRSMLVRLSSNGVVSITPSEFASDVVNSPLPPTRGLIRDLDFCKMECVELWTL